MNATWYCSDCATTIEDTEIEDHEADDHEVRGLLRPDRLLANDPWQLDANARGDR